MIKGNLRQRQSRSRNLAKGEAGEIVVNQTPFYGESGGQVGDTGVIQGRGGALFRVTDTQKKLGVLFVHSGNGRSRRFKTGDRST